MYHVDYLIASLYPIYFHFISMYFLCVQYLHLFNYDVVMMFINLAMGLELAHGKVFMKLKMITKKFHLEM
jgi:hypothetical protein